MDGKTKSPYHVSWIFSWPQAHYQLMFKTALFCITITVNQTTLQHIAKQQHLWHWKVNESIKLIVLPICFNVVEHCSPPLPGVWPEIAWALVRISSFRRVPYIFLSHYDLQKFRKSSLKSLELPHHFALAIPWCVCIMFTVLVSWPIFFTWYLH